MSHYPVLVCLPADTPVTDVENRLHDVLAPWDENLEVAPYRIDEKGAPGDHWALPQLRQRGWDLPGNDLTWHQVAAANNSEYAPDPEGPEWLFVDDDGAAYTISTYNPQSKWDWWVIGGRWRGHFIAVASARTDQLINPMPAQPTTGPPGRQPDQLRCDGGTRHLLDFTAMRDDAAAAAHARYTEWEHICARTPAARSWPQIHDLVTAGELSIEQARQRYQAQPRIVAADRAGLTDWSGCPVEDFRASRDDYVAAARAAAVPAYALVTIDRQWIAPGRMGWWGMSSDGPGERDSYHAIASRYLDQLGPDLLIVLIDCHI